MKTYLQLGVVYLTSFTAWFFVVPLVVYGYITNSFPGQGSLTILMMTLPSLFAMVGGFAAIPLTRIMSKKSIVIVALCLSLCGGLIIRFMGTSSLTIALIGAAITGIPAGLLPSVNNVVLPNIAPEKLREKVIGFNYAMLTLGMVIVTALSGFLAADGDWVRAYSVFYIIIPIITIVIFFYPRVKDNTTQDIALTTNTEPKERNDSSLISVLSSVPKFVIALLIVRFIAGFFYMGIPLNASEYFINERDINSSLVGMGASIANFFAIFGTAFVFIWLRKLKRFSLMMALVLCSIAGIASLTLPSVYANMFGWILAGMGTLIFSSAVNTLVVLGFKGKMAETISSLCIVAMFAGEFLAGYVSPLLSNLIFGGVSASANIQVATVGCIIIGIASVPYCKIAYKHLYASEKKESFVDKEINM
ncbi:MFS transporter [Cytobacillus pseudoceanisediminis]|uniref:MFS transporter n=1 Tax=Cytobacillus pseudoceanisediminis TaxID=3051614 RepID=UPI003C2C0FFB